MSQPTGLCVGLFLSIKDLNSVCILAVPILTMTAVHSYGQTQKCNPNSLKAKTKMSNTSQVWWYPPVKQADLGGRASLGYMTRPDSRKQQK